MTARWLEQEAGLHGVLDSIPDTAILALSTEGEILWWNQTTETLSGYDAGEIAAGRLGVFVAIDDVAAPETLERATREGRLSGDALRPRKDGRGVQVSWLLTPLRDADGQLRGFTLVLRDLTDRVRTDGMLRGVVENAIALLYVKDLEGRYLLYNRAFAEAFALEDRATADGAELSAMEVLLGRDDVWLDPKLQPVWRANDVRARDGAYFLEEWSDHPELGRITYDAIKFPLEDADGSIYATCGFSIDVSERVRAHTRLQTYAADLERANADLQQFSYAASHDLVEPLRTVSGFAQLLGKRYADALDDQGRRFLDHVVDGTQRMHVLIDELLAYARAGQVEFELAAVDCDELVAEVVRDLGATVEERAARVDVGPLPTVEADRGYLRHVFNDLLANALKFSGEDAPVIKVDAEQDGDVWRFDVVDNGIGVPTEHAEYIFDPFRRLHTREAYAGTGLGLAICRRAVERHGGRIWVEPAGGGGSRFSFTLSAGGQAARRAPAPAADREQGPAAGRAARARAG